MEKGKLSIHSENIFPIIKKWLYSDHDIFVREMISNACDAISKIRRLDSLGEADLKGEKDFEVKVFLDPVKKTLKFLDKGIGMTEEEVKKYINQIAFSGAKDFIETYEKQGQSEQIIGHFGLGFYSAFMVADRVEIDSLSYREGAQAVKWTCDGGTDFEMGKGKKKSRGTEITLHLGQSGKDFLDEYKLRTTIEKYCSFMPYPIYLIVTDKEGERDEEGNLIITEPEPLNNVSPLYLKQPISCTDEEYIDFYKETFREFQEPLFWIHLNMDYPFNLRGILYFPKLNLEFDSMEGRIKLYNNQVFVADNIKEVIPEFLLLLKGVIDCPDLPLNVSRSFLQNDGFVKKVSNYISNKVSDKLKELFNDDRDNFEKFWDDISPFVKYGYIKDESFYKKVEDLILYKTTAGDYLSLKEYLEKYEEKLGKQVYYVSDPQQQAQYIKMVKDYGGEAVILDHMIDSAFITHAEMKNQGLQFKRVDSDLSEFIKDKDEATNKEDGDKLEKIFRKLLANNEYKIQLKNFKSQDIGSMIILSEESRRMQEMMKQYNMAGMDPGMMPKEEVLVLNKQNSLVQHILEKGSEEDQETELIARHLYDLALLSHKPLSPEELTDFISRSNEIMKKMIEK